MTLRTTAQSMFLDKRHLTARSTWLLWEVLRRKWAVRTLKTWCSEPRIDFVAKKKLIWKVTLPKMHLHAMLKEDLFHIQVQRKVKLINSHHRSPQVFFGSNSNFHKKKCKNFTTLLRVLSSWAQDLRRRRNLPTVFLSQNCRAVKRKLLSAR